MSTSQKITIAVIGGGLAGATLANALVKHPHIDVKIFESASEFSERGAAVGINMGAQAALAGIGGPLKDVIERAGGVVMASSRAVMVSIHIIGLRIKP
jgi:salicylate hydroxylase